MTSIAPKNFVHFSLAELSAETGFSHFYPSECDIMIRGLMAIFLGSNHHNTGQKLSLEMNGLVEKTSDGGFLSTSNQQTILYGKPPILGGVQKFEVHLSKWPACVGVVTHRIANVVNESENLVDLLGKRGGGYCVWCIDGKGG